MALGGDTAFLEHWTMLCKPIYAVVALEGEGIRLETGASCWVLKGGGLAALFNASSWTSLTIYDVLENAFTTDVVTTLVVYSDSPRVISCTKTM